MHSCSGDKRRSDITMEAFNPVSADLAEKHVVEEKA